METMDDFREELEASFKKIRVGDVVTGTVIDVTEDQVIVDLKTYADGDPERGSERGSGF